MKVFKLLVEREANNIGQLLSDSQSHLSLDSLPETIVLDQHSVSSPLIDDLIEAEHNWIAILPSDWEIDLGSWVSAPNYDELGITYLKVQDLALMIHQLPYESLAIGQQICWAYTCCLRVAGLGRVRLVVVRSADPQFADNYIALATNRLDWSARKIIAQGLQEVDFQALNQFDSKQHLPFSSKVVSIYGAA
jgi:hypothetical protein